MKNRRILLLGSVLTGLFVISYFGRILTKSEKMVSVQSNIIQEIGTTSIPTLSLTPIISLSAAETSYPTITSIPTIKPSNTSYLKSTDDPITRKRLYQLQDRMNIWSDLINKYSSDINNYQQQLVNLEKELIDLQNISAEKDKECAVVPSPVLTGQAIEFPIDLSCTYRNDKKDIQWKQFDIDTVKGRIYETTNWLNDAILQYNRAKSEYEGLNK